jgi:hypothetical protein
VPALPDGDGTRRVAGSRPRVRALRHPDTDAVVDLLAAALDVIGRGGPSPA